MSWSISCTFSVSADACCILKELTMLSSFCVFLTAWNICIIYLCSSFGGGVRPHLAISQRLLQLHTGATGGRTPVRVHRCWSVSEKWNSFICVFKKPQKSPVFYSAMFVCDQGRLPTSRGGRMVRTWWWGRQPKQRTSTRWFRSQKPLSRMLVNTSAPLRTSWITSSTQLQFRWKVRLCRKHVAFPAEATNIPAFDSGSVLVGEACWFGFGPWGKWTLGVPHWWRSPSHRQLVHQRRAHRPWEFADNTRKKWRRIRSFLMCPFCLLSSASTLQPNVEVSGETVVLRSVTTLNNAVYQCNASNQYGYLLANAFVNVLRK